MAQLCNIIAPIVSTPEGSYVQTIYTPCQEYRKVMFGDRLSAEILGQYTVDGGNAGAIPAVSAAAVSNGGKRCISLVNRDFSEDITLVLPMNANITIYQADALAVNSMEHSAVQKFSVTGTTVTLPAGSFCIAIEA